MNTPNYNLKKVEYTEIADIPAHFNGNMDTIDVALKAHDNELASKETPAGAQQKADAAEGNAKGFASGLIGSLTNLLTTAKSNLVAAINEIFGKVEDVGDALAAHKADDVTQGKIPHIGLGGCISHETDTGVVTPPHVRTVISAADSRASGSRSTIVGGSTNTAVGIMSSIIGSRSSRTEGESSVVIGSGWSTVTGNRSSIISSGATSIYPNENTGTNSVIVCSRSTKNEESGCIVGGFVAQGSSALTSNRKFVINVWDGDIKLAGQLTPGHSFADLAEVFPNLTEKEQGYGLLQTIDGFGVRPAQEGERIIGVTSATAGIILGDTPFSWQGRWLKDEWGAYIYETIIDEETREEITYPKENPEWNPELEQVSRLERPDEWTVVGLVGQVYVRLKEDVQPMDYVKAWQNGVGQKSLEPTNLQVMKITQEYDAEKGYKIGFCLLR